MFQPGILFKTLIHKSFTLSDQSDLRNQSHCGIKCNKIYITTPMGLSEVINVTAFIGQLMDLPIIWN